MNSFEFNGSFASGLSFAAVIAIMLAVSVLMIPAQLWCNEEEQHVGPRDGHEPLNGAVAPAPLAREEDGQQCSGCTRRLRDMLSTHLTWQVSPDSHGWLQMGCTVPSGRDLQLGCL